MEWEHLYIYVLLILVISDKIHQCFLSLLSKRGRTFFNSSFQPAIVCGVVCINIMFVTCRVGHRAWAVLWQLFSSYLCGARQQYSLHTLLSPAICLRENHTVCTERFVLGSSDKIVAFSMAWCNQIKAQGNLGNLRLWSKGIYIGVTSDT